MALYEHIYLARQDVSAQQVEELTNALTEVLVPGRRQGHQERVLGPQVPLLPHQEEPQGSLQPAQHRRPGSGRCRDGAPDAHQRRHPALHDRARRRARGRPVGHDAEARSRRRRWRPSAVAVRPWRPRRLRPATTAARAASNRKDIRPMAIKDLTTAQARRPFQRRRKTCPFSGANAPKIDYKDVRLLQRYVSERGKIVPSPHHRRFGAEAARTGPGHQARPLHRHHALRGLR